MVSAMECRKVDTHFVGINVTQHDMAFQDFLIELPAKAPDAESTGAKRVCYGPNDYRVLLRLHCSMAAFKIVKPSYSLIASSEYPCNLPSGPQQMLLGPSRTMIASA
jgi:hypothetical protein